MASDTGTKAARGGWGGVLSGLNEGLEASNKNRYDRDTKENQRRFELAKMYAQDMLQKERQTNQNQYQRDQWTKRTQENDRLQRERMNLQEELYRGRPSKEKEEAPSMDEIIALASGELVGDKYEDVNNDDETEASIVSEIAKRYGYQQSGEREKGALWWKKKIPTYSKNQFSR